MTNLQTTAGPQPALAEHPRVAHFWPLVGIVAFALPLFAVRLGSGDATDMMELFNLVPIREALRDGNWLMPTLNGVPRLQKPPLPVWIPGGFAALLGSDALWIVRLPSILLGLASCWAMYVLAFHFTGADGQPQPRTGRTFAFLSAVMAAVMIGFIRHTRLASYDIYAAAFALLGLVGLVLLAEGHRAGTLTTARRWALILLAAGGMGLSVLSKGPTTPATLVVPFLVWLFLFCRGRGLGRFLGDLVIAGVISLLLFVPWLLAMALRYPEAWAMWKGELWQYVSAQPNGFNDPQLRDPLYYYALFFTWVFPLTPLLVGGLVLALFPRTFAPKLTDREQRGVRFFLLVGLGGLLMLSLAAEKKPRYALHLMPLAGVLGAAVWREFRRMRPAEKIEWPAALLWFAQGGVLIAGGLAMVAAPLALLGGPGGGFLGKLRAGLAPNLVGLPAAAWIGLGLVVASAGVLFIRAVHRERATRAAVLLLLSAWVMELGWWAAYKQMPAYQHSEQRGPVEHLATLVGRHPVYLVDQRQTPWLPLLYYMDRVIPVRSLEALLARTQHEPCMVLVRVPPAAQTPSDMHAVIRDLHAAGRKLTELGRAHDGHHMYVLYRVEAQ